MEARESYDAEERFTPEEAVEILKRAVALEKDQFSAEDLYAMGQEAGVSREAVQQAIAEYRELQRQMEEERLRRERQIEAERLRYERETKAERLRRKREQELRERQFHRFWQSLIQMIILMVVFFGIFALMSTCMLRQFEQETRRRVPPEPWRMDRPDTFDRPIIVLPRRESESMQREQ